MRNDLAEEENRNVAILLRHQLAQSYICHRPADHLEFDVAYTAQAATVVSDTNLVSRIINSYRSASKHDISNKDSLWETWIGPYKQDIDAALLSGDAERVTKILRDPSASRLFMGFDNLVIQEDGSRAASQVWAEWMAAWTYDALRRLAEAAGLYNLALPEGFQQKQPENPSADEILSALDDTFGFRIEFPNPFENEFGIRTSRGVATYRAVHAIYQAWRAFEAVDRDQTAKVLEIGPGLGRGAYYARAFGLSNYALIDLPMTNAAQGYYLGRICGEDHVRLYGEPASELPSFSILPPHEFLEGREPYDLILNVDSMTEMGLPTASRYWQQIKFRTRKFLSINHEANEFRVADFLTEVPRSKRTRHPSWLRKGYVDEEVTF